MTDCELYGHPNIDGCGCPCGRIVRQAPPPSILDPATWPQPLPPVLARLRGDAPREQSKAQLRTHRTSLRRPEVWA